MKRAGARYLVRGKPPFYRLGAVGGGFSHRIGAQSNRYCGLGSGVARVYWGWWGLGGGSRCRVGIESREVGARCTDMNLKDVRNVPGGGDERLPTVVQPRRSPRIEVHGIPTPQRVHDFPKL